MVAWQAAKSRRHSTMLLPVTRNLLTWLGRCSTCAAPAAVRRRSAASGYMPAAAAVAAAATAPRNAQRLPCSARRASQHAANIMQVMRLAHVARYITGLWGLATLACWQMRQAKRGWSGFAGGRA